MKGKSNTIRSIACWLSPLAVAALGAECYAADEQPLNVIVVMTDDQGYPDLGVHGNPDVRTPNMDALAAQSVRLTDFHVNPFCSPTRAALLTGRMSDRTGVTRTNFQRNYLRRNEVLMSEFFQASGYRTGIFGKWHIGGNYPYRPIDRGFDRWVGLGNNGLSTTSDAWNNDRLDDMYWMDGQKVALPGFNTDVFFDHAMRFMDDARAKNHPFFAYIATNVPHWDWSVPPAWIEPYAKVKPRERACFYASVERADWNLGRLMEYLDRTGIAERTLLVFLTDNGTDVPDKNTAYLAGMRGWKGSLYEGGHRVPCFIRGPKSLVGEPRDVGGLTAHLDLLPTFVDLCGLAKPERTHPSWDGRSLRPLLSGDGPWPERMLVMHHHNNLNTPAKGQNSLVMTSRWRLVNGKELYDIQNDPAQKHDVAAEHGGVVRQLRQAYDKHWTELGFDRHPPERPVLGPADAPTLHLTTDLAEHSSFIWQNAVRTGQRLNRPIWLAEIPQAGRYRFEVRRWPSEADAAMTAALPPNSNPGLIYSGYRHSLTDVSGKALPIASVELRLSTGQILRSEVAPDARFVAFETDLPAGSLDIEAWFLDRQDKRITGAYYVYAKPLPNP